MAHLKTPPGHWRPSDFGFAAADGPRAPGPVLHIARTVALLESRADQYAAYLHALLDGRGPDWAEALARWNAEEAQHGVVLRRLCEAADAGFRFDDCMAAYRRSVAYHACDGRSVRGSVAAELVARCVVEALASSLYRVLADASADPRQRAVFDALARDEARHFGMFRSMLREEEAAGRRLGTLPRLAVMLRRLLALEDAQIMHASFAAAGRPGGTFRARQEAHRYLALLYGHYRWRHVLYAGRMLLSAFARPRPPAVTLACAGALFLALKGRWLWALLRRPRSGRDVPALPAG